MPVPARGEPIYTPGTNVITCSHANRINCASLLPGTERGMWTHYYGHKRLDFFVGFQSNIKREKLTYLWARDTIRCPEVEEFQMTFLSEALLAMQECGVIVFNKQKWATETSTITEEEWRTIAADEDWADAGWEVRELNLEGACPSGRTKDVNSTYVTRLRLSYTFSTEGLQCPNIFLFVSGRFGWRD